MNSKIVLIPIAVVCAAASGCTNKAAAQTPPTPARTLTADTDVNQLIGGTVTTPAAMGGYIQVYQKVADGPIVLTDGLPRAGATWLYVLPAGQDCTMTDTGAIEALDGTNGRVLVVLQPGGTQPNLQGVRMLIRQGEELCASWLNTSVGTGFAWSGWKPY